MKIPKEIYIMSVIAIGIIALGFFFLSGTQKPVEPGKQAGDIIREDSHMTGNKNATVTLIEFGDFQCPACSAAHPIVKEIVDEYKSNPNFNFVFMNFPITSHANAQISAQAAEAAGEQGKYWEMFDKLYERQKEWSNISNPLNVFVGYAQELSLDTEMFRKAVEDKKFSNVIIADKNKGDELKVTGTPTFFLNGAKIVGVPDPVALKKSIDDLLAQ